MISDASHKHLLQEQSSSAVTLVDVGWCSALGSELAAEDERPTAGIPKLKLPYDVDHSHDERGHDDNFAEIETIELPQSKVGEGHVVLGLDDDMDAAADESYGTKKSATVRETNGNLSSALSSSIRDIDQFGSDTSSPWPSPSLQPQAKFRGSLQIDDEDHEFSLEDDNLFGSNCAPSLAKPQLQIPGFIGLTITDDDDGDDVLGFQTNGQEMKDPYAFELRSVNSPPNPTDLGMHLDDESASVFEIRIVAEDAHSTLASAKDNVPPLVSLSAGITPVATAVPKNGIFNSLEPTSGHVRMGSSASSINARNMIRTRQPINSSNQSGTSRTRAAWDSSIAVSVPITSTAVSSIFRSPISKSKNLRLPGTSKPSTGPKAPASPTPSPISFGTSLKKTQLLCPSPASSNNTKRRDADPATSKPSFSRPDSRLTNFGSRRTSISSSRQTMDFSQVGSSHSYSHRGWESLNTTPKKKREQLESYHQHRNSYSAKRGSISSSLTYKTKSAVAGGQALMEAANARKALRDEYEAILASRNQTDRDMRESLRRLRRMVLDHGIPDHDETGTVLSSKPSSCSLRGRIWKALLGIYRVSALEYVTLASRGPSEVYDKIKNDAFRTLATDKKFVGRVSESMILRVLNAFVWKAKDQPPSRLMNLKFSYVQGMNVLAAPFLYVMPELDAYFTFTSFINHTCPLYVQPALEGVHCGIKLLDKCLKIADPCLYRFLKGKKLDSVTYAFPSVMTFCACTQPLLELLKLWDFLLSYGVHLNVLCIAAQLIMIRGEIMNSTSPMKILRTLPDLNAAAIIATTLKIIPLLPEGLYDMLVRHPFDAMVFDVILPESSTLEDENV